MTSINGPFLCISSTIKRVHLCLICLICNSHVCNCQHKKYSYRISRFVYVYFSAKFHICGKVVIKLKAKCRFHMVIVFVLYSTEKLPEEKLYLFQGSIKLTNQPNQWSRVFPLKLLVTQLVKKFPEGSLPHSLGSSKSKALCNIS
jgi:hypothetical protein